MSYGNFHNPVGLVGRMLRSRRKAAYAALIRAGLEIAVTPFDHLLSKFKRNMHRLNAESEHPILLIVGPPRAGTTLIYQYLAASLDVSYPTNLSSLFPKSMWNGRCRPATSAKQLQSYFGQTARLNDPNDAFHAWNRWLGADRYLAKTELSDCEAEQIRSFFSGWTQRAGKPFLNKNNRNCHCLAMLGAILPNAYFIIVTRDPLAIVRSLIRARERVQGSKSIGWGLLSQEKYVQAPLGYVRDVCEQVGNVNRLIAEQSVTIDPERLIHVSYESFCEAPMLLAEAAAKIDGVRLRDQAGKLPASFHRSEAHPLSDAEELRIKDYLPS